MNANTNIEKEWDRHCCARGSNRHGQCKPAHSITSSAGNNTLLAAGIQLFVIIREVWNQPWHLQRQSNATAARDEGDWINAVTLAPLNYFDAFWLLIQFAMVFCGV